jgi:hypothetical protein
MARQRNTVTDCRGVTYARKWINITVMVRTRWNWR